MLCARRLLPQWAEWDCVLLRHDFIHSYGCSVFWAYFARWPEQLCTLIWL